MFLVDAGDWRGDELERVARCDVDHDAADCFERPLSLASLTVAVPNDKFAASDSQPHAHVSLEELMDFRIRHLDTLPARVLEPFPV